MSAFYAWLASLAEAGSLPGPFRYAFVVRGPGGNDLLTDFNYNSPLEVDQQYNVSNP